MYRKVGYVFCAAVGSFAVICRFKNQCFKDSRDEFQFIKAANAQDVRRETENNERNILLSPSVSTTGYEKQNLALQNAITKARDLAYRKKDEVGAPGLVIGVSINGKTVWVEGLGMADVENRVPCHPYTVMRIASISKSMTMAVVAKLWEDGKLNLDKPVQYYVPSFPQKMFNKEEVTVTTRQLVSHLAGIRHYEKTANNNNNNNNSSSNNNNNNNNDDDNNDKEIVSKQIKDKRNKVQANSAAARKNSNSTVHPEADKEFYSKERFASVQDALKIFQDDDLMFKPGTSFLYTTHGWTLVSAVVEAAASKPFPDVMKKFFQVMGLKHTYLDEAEPLIYNRSRYYSRNARGNLKNVPYVDNSCKWAGGGLLSTVGDLLLFGNAMLYSYQWRSELNKSYPPGYLKAETMQTMWTVQPGTTRNWGRDDGYGMGWVVVPSRQEYGGGDVQAFAVGHTGGAVGASSVLLVVPNEVPYPAAIPSDSESTHRRPSVSNSLLVFSSPESGVPQGSDVCVPCGVTVAIIMNLGDVGLHRLAMDIAGLFCEM